MDITLRKIRALLKKEVKGLPKNKNIFLMCLLPIFFSVAYVNVFGGSSNENELPKTEVLFMCLGMNLILVCSYIIAMLIAEEKEKNTLRTLMLSGVTPLEFFAGKMLITVLISEISNIIIFFVVGIDSQYLGIYLLLTTLVIFCMVGLGGAIGIIAPNQMTTGVVGLPILMILYFIPVMAMVNDSLKNISKYLPNYSMKLMLDKIILGGTLGSEAIFQTMVIFVWIILSVVIFAVTYYKVGLDK